MEVLVSLEEGGSHAEDELVDLAEFVLGQEGAPANSELSVSLVGPEKMAELNRYYLGREGPTDVLSFSMEEECEGAYLLGDVVICREEAARRRELYGVQAGDEVRLVLIHGILHLLGYDDRDEEGNLRMDERQRSLLEAWKRGRG
jgi:probable rRNA maturation factor